MNDDDWASLFHSLTADTLDSVDTQSTANADTTSAPITEPHSVKSVSASKEEERHSVNSVQSVNVSKWEEKEAAISPLVAALAALEATRPDHNEAADWQHAVEDGRRFSIQGGERATALGWVEPDVFGLPPIPSNPHPSWRRLARVDQLGLVWLTHGRPVTSITAESATIATPRGGSLAFYRPRARQEGSENDRTQGAPPVPVSSRSAADPRGCPKSENDHGVGA